MVDGIMVTNIKSLVFIDKKDSPISFRCYSKMNTYFNEIKYPIYLKEFNEVNKNIKISNRSDLINYLILYAILNDAIPDIIYLKELR